MADFRLNVTADTQRAEKDLQRLGKTADSATKDRSLRLNVSELSKSFKDVERNVKEAGNTIQTFYRISKNIPGIGERVREVENLAKGTAAVARSAPGAAAALRENAKAGSILANSFEAAGAGAGRLVNNLAKAGFALFAVKEAVGLVQAAFGGFFNETIGREIKLRETILKTQTTLASTNKVFRDGKEITDPYEKIVALTGEVAKRIDSIRERSIALAGVTSGEVIEVFGMVASQIGQIGGGLKDAEDLAINFAAALGTFGIPLYQARQEIGSILRGDITVDSQLATALGIRDKDIQEAKGKIGGVVGYLKEKLAASVAGQAIAAQGFAGVVSNIKDLGELISQRFGAGLLDPMLGGLTKLFDFLFKIREEVFAISEGLGRGLGSLLSTNLSVIGGGSALFGQIGAGAEGFAAQLVESVKKAFASLQSSANTVIAPLRNIFEEIAKSIGLVGAGLARLAQGFISIKIENFKALVQIFSNLSEAVTGFSAVLGQVLRAYGQLLQVPFVQYLSQISVQFQLLEKIGVMSVVKLGFAAAALIAAWTPIVTFVQGLVARIAALLGGLVIAVGAALVRIGALVAAFAATLTATYPAAEALKQQLLGLAASLNTAGVAADKAGVSVSRFGGATTAAARAAGGAILSFVKFNLILLGVQLAITALIDVYGRFQQRQEETARSQRAGQALKDLQTKYKDVGDAASSAEKSAKGFAEALVNTEYGRNLDELEKVREKINQIRYELKPGIQSWDEFWDALSGSEMGRFEARSREILQGLINQEKELKGKLGAVDAARDKKQLEDNIRLQADNRINLEKEIAEVRKQQEDQIFQIRQQRAQKEVDIFRAAGELRIFQMEEANKKLIEGEEGASRTALEALNNYISVRERGELEIEAAKKSLVIEAANLEKQISDYRLENEKKIAEIRKRAGDYEKNVGDYRRQLAGQIAAGTGGGAATFGATGNVNNAPGWVHGHFQTNSGTLDDLVGDVIPVLKALLDQGIPVQLSSGLKVQGGKDDNYYRSILKKGAGQHSHSGDGRSIDLFVPEGTKVPVPLADVTGPSGRGGISGVLPGSGKSWVGHLASGSKAGGAAALTPPQAPSFANIGAPAADKYAAAIRSLTSAMARLQAIQAALTDAKTKSAFDEIAKSVFQPVGLESYQDKLYELDGVIKSIGTSSYDAFNPERSQIAAEQSGKILSSQRELQQILIGISKQTKLSETERADLVAQTLKRHEAFVKSLRDEEQTRLRLNAIQQGVDLARQFAQETAQINRDNEVIRLRNRLIAEGVSPDVLEREIEKLKNAQQFRAVNELLNTSLQTQADLRDKLQQQLATAAPGEKAQLQQRLDEAMKEVERLRALIAQLQGEKDKLDTATDTKPKQAEDKRDLKDVLRKWQEELQNTDEEVAQLAETVQTELGSAMSNAVFAVLDGTGTIQEAFGNMFKNIYQTFVKMVMDMVAKWAILSIFKAFGFSFAEGGVFGGTQAAANGASFANGIASFARGGAFSNSVVYKPTLFAFRDGGSMNPGVLGEAGPEAIMPLSRGPGGKLGVIAHGAGDNSGSTNVVVNVDASGSKVQGDTAKATEFGRALSVAVEQEIIKHKRPGGLLS